MGAISSRGRRGSTIVPNWRWEDPDLDCYTLRVAGWLASHADSYLDEHVGRNQIANHTAISRARVSASLDVLVGLGIIEISEATNSRMRITFDFDAWEGGRHTSTEWTPHVHQVDATRPLPKYIHGEEQEVVSRGEPSVEARHLCTQLADAIEASGSKRPNVTNAWLTDMDRLIRLDERPVERVEAVIHWLSTGTDAVAQFWWPNIRSPRKLREKWDQMRMQYERRSQPSQSKNERSMDAIRRMAEGG